MSQKKKPSAIVNILFNIVIPVIIMTKLSKPEYLGPMYGLSVALLFPLGYGLYDFILTRDVNVISIIGLVSILLTGVLGLFQFAPMWVAVKEASVPLVIAACVVISEYTKFPLVRKMLYNDSIMDVDLIEKKLKESSNQAAFSVLMRKSAYFISFSFIFSSVLNYLLAVMIVKSEPGSVDYTQEIGQMTGLSFPVIALPSMVLMAIILFYLIKQIKKLTGLEFEDIFKNQ